MPRNFATRSSSARLASCRFNEAAADAAEFCSVPLRLEAILYASMRPRQMPRNFETLPPHPLSHE